MNRELLDANRRTADIAGSYGLSLASLKRHKSNHLRVSTALVSERSNALTIVAYAQDLYERANRLLSRAESILDEGELGQDLPSRRVQASAAALRELRASIELLAKLVVTAEPEPEAVGNSWLDAALTEAVASLALPALPSADVAEAEIVQAHD